MKLIIEDDEGRKTVVPIVREDVEITIGRQEGNTIRLTERNVSRKHAKLIRKSGVVTVEDLGAYNGIKVNGDRIQGTVQLKEGDLVQIGDYDLAIQGEELPKPAPAAALSERTLQTAVPEGEDADEGDGPDTPPPVAKKHDSTAVISGAQLKSSRPSRKVVDIRAEEAPRLLLTTTELAGREYACIRSELKIGRTDDNDIAIDHRSISRNHCKVVREDGAWKVIDLKSANGVKINGEQYAESTLKPGDVLELGHLKFRFLAPGEEAPAVGEAAEGSGKKRGAGLIIAVAVVLVLGAGGFAGWWFGLRKKPAVPPQAKIETPADPKAADPQPDQPKPADPKIDEPKLAPVDPGLLPPGDKPADNGLPPPDPKLLKIFERGKELFAQGKFAEAEKRFARCKDMMVDGAAEWLTKTRDEMEAEKSLEAARKRLAAGDPAGAREALAGVGPETSFAARAKPLEAQIAAAEEKLKAEEERKKAAAAKAAPTGPKQEAVDAFNEGQALLKEKKYKEAIRFFQTSVEHEPKYADAHLFLGFAFAQSGDSRQGAWHYEEFVHLAPNHPSAKNVKDILRAFFDQSKGVTPRYPLPP